MRFVPFRDEHGQPAEVLAVHAGLDGAERLSAQVDTALMRSADRHWVEFLQGRGNVVGVHPELPESTVLASGHHGGKLLLDGRRIILDTMGGYADRPFTALVMRGKDPTTWQTIRDDDDR